MRHTTHERSGMAVPTPTSCPLRSWLLLLAGLGACSANGPAADGRDSAPDSAPPPVDAVVIADAVVDSIADAQAQDSEPLRPCSYSQPIAYVDPSVEGGACGPGDGTCVSGTITYDQTLYTIAEGDIGEAYLFGKPDGAPMFIFRRTTPPEQMPFKIPNIPSAATDACNRFEIGGRLDIGGDHQGMPGGPEDPVLAPDLRAVVALHAEAQVNGIEFTIR
jgi:hypothetical protein